MECREVDGADSPGGVEIGHNPDAESSGWARPGGDADRPGGSSDGVLAEVQSEGTVPSPVEQAGLLPSAPSIARRRVFAAAAGIAMLALLVWWAIDRAGGDTVTSDGGEQGAVITQAATTLSTAVVSTTPEAGAAAISSTDSAAATPPPTISPTRSAAPPDECRGPGGPSAPAGLEPPPDSAAPPEGQAPGQARVTADYRFENSLADSVGAATELAAIGADATGFIDEAVLGQTRPVLRFDRGSGLALTPASVAVGSEYTIELVFRFDRLRGYAKIVDFNNATKDCGLYSMQGRIDFWPITTGLGAMLKADSYAHVVLTRDANDTVVAYFNGARQLSFHDTGDLAVIDADNTLRLFSDDTVTPNEDAGGAVSRIRLYDRALTASEVAALAAELPITPPTLARITGYGPVSTITEVVGDVTNGTAEPQDVRVYVVCPNRTVETDIVFDIASGDTRGWSVLCPGNFTSGAIVINRANLIADTPPYST
jgi:concanavalin A-like lectin/glucanase superfamily protein